MPIGKQIHAFLEVSEAFLRQPGIEVPSDGWLSLEAVSVAHDNSILRLGALIVHNTSGGPGNGCKGKQGSGVMPEHRQDGA